MGNYFHFKNPLFFGRVKTQLLFLAVCREGVMLFGVGGITVFK